LGVPFSALSGLPLGANRDFESRRPGSEDSILDILFEIFQNQYMLRNGGIEDVLSVKHLPHNGIEQLSKAKVNQQTMKKGKTAIRSTKKVTAHINPITTSPPNSLDLLDRRNKFWPMLLISVKMKYTTNADPHSHASDMFQTTRDIEWCMNMILNGIDPPKTFIIVDGAKAIKIKSATNHPHATPLAYKPLVGMTLSAMSIPNVLQ
jgi:hypothetical protein